MACRIIPSQTFGKELDAVIEYLAVDLQSRAAASSLMQSLQKAWENLEAYPEMGPVSSRPGLMVLEMREYRVRDYVVIYRFDGERVFLEHIFHTLQDYERLIENSDVEASDDGRSR